MEEVTVSASSRSGQVRHSPGNGEEMSKPEDLKALEREPNETIEAYTGNHIARKGDRNPPSLVYDSLDKGLGGESLKSRWRWC